MKLRYRITGREKSILNYIQIRSFTTPSLSVQRYPSPEVLSSHDNSLMGLFEQALIESGANVKQ